MKIRFLSATALLLLLAQTTISCNSCEDRNNDPIPSQTPEVGINNAEAGDGAAFDDGSSSSMDASSTSIDRQVDNSTRTSGTTQSGSATSVKTPSKPPRPPKPTYSAPNGTDAENHDGDPYTKHDTTSMPTGTSIR